MTVPRALEDELEAALEGLRVCAADELATSRPVSSQDDRSFEVGNDGGRSLIRTAAQT